MKKYLLFFSLLCMSLFAEAEYDIILLAPEGEEFTSESDWDCVVTMNNAGYVAGTIRGENGDLVPYVYHPDFGFKSFDLPSGATLEGDFEGTRMINSHGVAVGMYSKDSFSFFDPSIFVYDSTSGECFDLLDALGADFEDRSCARVFITDENKVIFLTARPDWYWHSDEDLDTLVHIYDLNSKLLELFSEKGLADVNLRGQMTGAENWFFDPQTGFQKLGSIDRFNRWLVNPEVLSKNGVVAGIGLDSHREEKGFVWSPDFGIHSFDIFGDWTMILGVNDKGTVIWVSEVDDEYDEYDRSFIFSLEKGSFDLETLGGSYTVALGINQHDQVVGSSETKKGKDRAFIWDFKQGMRDLTTLIPDNTGWKALTRAIEINDSGCIVGIGRYFGAEHHFLLIPRK